MLLFSLSVFLTLAWFTSLGVSPPGGVKSRLDWPQALARFRSSSFGRPSKTPKLCIWKRSQQQGERGEQGGQTLQTWRWRREKSHPLSEQGLWDHLCGRRVRVVPQNDLCCLDRKTRHPQHSSSQSKSFWCSHVFTAYRTRLTLTGVFLLTVKCWRGPPPRRRACCTATFLTAFPKRQGWRWRYGLFTFPFVHQNLSPVSK